MALTFQGINPTESRTGLQAKQYLEGVYGQPLSPQQMQQAGQFMSTRGYNDPTGAAAMTGEQWNALLQEASRQTPGSTFTAWQQPTASGGQEPLTLQNEPPPAYTAPTLQTPDAYQAQTPFSYEPWRATTSQDLYADPSYEWRKKQSIGAMDASAAAKGLLRTGGAMTALADYAGQAASQEFGNVDARRRADYSLGYGTARDIHGVNTDERRYANEQGVDRAQRIYDAASQGAQAEYAPQILGWQSARDDRNRTAELNFDRQWQQRLYEGDDAFRRQQAERDEAYRNRTYSTDDEFRRWLANLHNQQFIAELGTRD